MPVVELSSAFVRQACCPCGQRKVDYFDSNQRGFLIEIRCSGRKTYYQRFATSAVANGNSRSGAPMS